jgi:hypothetical protein
MKSPTHAEIPPPQQTGMHRLIRVLLITALVLLPFSHLRWLPNFGTTRPISSVFFVLVLGLITLTEGISWIRQGKLQLKRFWEGWLALPGAPILVPWLILILLGILSAALTPFYGNFLQALNRLLGYVIIFATLYCGLAAYKLLGMPAVARWISLGYLPVLLYAIIEAAATQEVGWALQVVQSVRGAIVVEYPWIHRISLLATEPSFVGFQLLLLIALLPFLQSRLLRITNLLIILIAAVFSQSLNVLLGLGIYLAFLLFFQLSLRVRLWLTAGGVVSASLLSTWVKFWAPFQISPAALEELSAAWNIPRLALIPKSFAIRVAHLLNLIHTLIDTRGLGLGIGQYGVFWKEIFLRHFDPNVVDDTGEIARALASEEYGRPWSVIFGIGADLGILGMALLMAFFYRIWRSLHSPHSRGIFFASLFALLGAYPIVTPHAWLALALLTASAAPEIQEAAAA